MLKQLPTIVRHFRAVEVWGQVLRRSKVKKSGSHFFSAVKLFLKYITIIKFSSGATKYSSVHLF
jgi:hypothetical protein